MKITAVRYILHILRNLLIPFSLTMVLIYTMMYFIPGTPPFHPDYPWPFSAIKWIIDFLTLRAFHHAEMAYDPWILKVYTWNTLKFLFGSLAISGIIVSVLLYFRFTTNNKLFQAVMGLLNISSGFHILILGLVCHRIWPTIEKPLDLRLLFILALGNGSLVELYNTLEAEFENILKKEYVLAGVAWGFSKIRFPLRELFLTVMDFLNARIPILLSSTIVIEFVFALDGLSYNILRYIEYREYENILLVSALFSLFVLGSNVLVDMFHYSLDPRARNV